MIDPLAEVLRSVRLSGGVFVDARFTAPWCVKSRVTEDDWGAFLTRPSLVIAYHVILEGAPLLMLAGERPMLLRAGEVVLLPRNDTHILASGPGLKPVGADALIRPAPGGGLARIVHGGGGATTRMVCGFLGSEMDQPLFAALPRVLRLALNEGSLRTWVEASVGFAASELADGLGATSGIMARLSELLLIEAVRRYAASLPEAETGWLRGVNDRQIGRALALIHADPASPWSAEQLARAAALSRSAFVERFTTLMGAPPIRYLTALRLQAARRRLEESRASVGELAYQVGYGSEEAFSRAFKREFGMSPARWREQRWQSA
jgi:AraC-like DNA-binding protein